MFPPELEFLTPMLADDKLNELMFNGFQQAFAEREGKLLPTPVRAMTEKTTVRALALESVTSRKPNSQPRFDWPLRRDSTSCSDTQ